MSGEANHLYEKRMVIRQLIGPTYQTVQTFDLDCYMDPSPSFITGVVETQELQTRGGTSDSIKEILGWNTTIPGFARVESVYQKKEFLTANSAIIDLDSGSSRIEIYDSNKFLANTVNFRATENAGTYFQSHQQRDMFSGIDNSDTYINSAEQMFQITHPQVGYIFDSKSLDQAFRKETLILESQISKSPNSLKMARIWLQYEAANSIYRVYVSTYNGTTWTPMAGGALSGASYDASKPTVAINDNGNIVAGWMENGQVKRRVFTGGNWTTEISHYLTSGAAISEIQSCIDGDVAAIVWSQNSGTYDEIYFGFTQDLSTSNTWVKASSASSDKLSSGTTNARHPKCVVKDSASDEMFISFTEPGNSIVKVMKGLINAGNYAGTVSNLQANTTNAFSSSAESFLSKDGANIVISVVDVSGFKRRFYNGAWQTATTAPGSTWSNTFCKYSQDPLGTDQPCPTLPINLRAPATHTVAGEAPSSKNSFGLFESNPVTVENKFTDSDTFKGQ